MNAVKRCLALFAATLVVGACSGDPTADDAGTGLTIRTTPSVVWMREDQTLEIDVEAIDALGGTQPGSWTVTTSGPVTAALDPDYQETSTGGLAQIRRFILTPTAAGEGSVTFSGTGGDVTVPVRISPDPIAFAATISNENPAIAEEITVTAPAGVRFTAGTQVSFRANGTDTIANGLAAPSITAFNTDSTQITVLPAPGAIGRMRFTGVANVSTPTLVQTVTTAVGDSVTVPPLTSMAVTFSSATPAVNTPITITAPVNFKFRPTSTFTSNGMAYTVVSRAADSLSVVVFPTAGTAGPVSITNVQFAPLPTLSLTLPSTDPLTVAAAPNLGDDDASAGPVGIINVNLAVGGIMAVHDQATYDAPDWVGFGACCGQQDVELNVTTAGNYRVRLYWPNAADIDIAIVDGGITAFLGTALTANNPETITANLPAGTSYLLTGFYAGSAPAFVKYEILRN